MGQACACCEASARFSCSNALSLKCWLVNRGARIRMRLRDGALQGLVSYDGSREARSCGRISPKRSFLDASNLLDVSRCSENLRTRGHLDGKASVSGRFFEVGGDWLAARSPSQLRDLGFSGWLNGEASLASKNLALTDTTAEKPRTRGQFFRPLSVCARFFGRARGEGGATAASCDARKLRRPQATAARAATAQAASCNVRELRHR